MTDAVLLHDLLDRRAEQAPQAPALTRETSTWSYGELRDRSLAYAGWLAQRGVGRGDRVLVVAPHAAETAALAFAASRLGAIFAVISDQIRPYLLEHVLADSGPRLVVGTSEAATAAIESKPGSSRGETPEPTSSSGSRRISASASAARSRASSLIGWPAPGR